MNKYFYFILISFGCMIVRINANAQSKDDSILFTVYKYNKHPKNYHDALLILRVYNNSSDTLTFCKNDDIYFETKKVDIKTSYVQKYFPGKSDENIITYDQIVLLKVEPGKYLDFATSQHFLYGLGKGTYQEKFFLDLSNHNFLKKTIETEWVTISYTFED